MESLVFECPLPIQTTAATISISKDDHRDDENHENYDDGDDYDDDDDIDHGQTSDPNHCSNTLNAKE